MPIVSIIINIYNGEATLRETLDSVFAQTFADWELIVWDDCSSDTSAKIISDYSDPRLRFYSSEVNQGLGPSRKSALEHATGEWVAYVDQDDLWLPGKLAIQITTADQLPEAGFIYGRAIKFYPDGKMMDYDHRHEFQLLPEGDIFERLFIDSCFIAISTVLFRRAALTSVAEIPDYISTCPDYYLYLEISRRYKVAAVQAVVCHYRVHSGNMTRTNGQRMQREILRLIDHWGNSLPAGLADKRRKIHSTVLALQQMRFSGQFGSGIRILATDGALLYLLGRPIIFCFRYMRRKLLTPYWRRPQSIGGDPE